MTAPGNPPPAAPRGPLRWCFEDRSSGKIVVMQWPNLPVWIFLAALAVQYVLHPAGALGTAVTVIAALSLAWWALDELVRGANPWRRFLGAAGLVYLVWHYGPLLVGSMP